MVRPNASSSTRSVTDLSWMNATHIPHNVTLDDMTVSTAYCLPVRSELDYRHNVDRLINIKDKYDPGVSHSPMEGVCVEGVRGWEAERMCGWLLS